MKKLLAYFEKRKWLTFGLTLLWTVLIFIGCSMPGRELPKMGLFDHFDKVVHFGFFVLFFAGWFLLSKRRTRDGFCLLFLSAVYGFGMEWYQLHFVAGRSFDVWDGVADTTGAAAGWWMAYHFLKNADQV